MREVPTARKRYVIWGIALLFCIFVFLLLKPYYDFLTQTVGISPIKALIGIDGLQRIDDKVTILILGIPGGTHEGPTLSDSITVMSYDMKKNTASSIGIPRDIWSETLQDRVNSAYAYGEAKMRGGGMKLAKAEVGAIIGVPIQYAVVLNFQEFKELIDLLGGIDIEIKNSFVDKKFPIEGRENDECAGDPEFKCRYETISFTKGKTHVNGEVALTFVRSRNAEGEEGTDFARNQRQQIVMSAVKEKIVSTILRFNLSKIRKLYANVNESVERDFTNQQATIIAKNILFKGGFNQKSTAVPRDLLIVPDFGSYEGRYVLVPEDNSFERVHAFVASYIGLNTGGK